MQRITLTLPGDLTSIFFPLLSQGIDLKVAADTSIKTFLQQDLRIDADYIDQRIQTIFLNGKAVDDLDTALLHDGAVLALSAAMPGLVGATFRRAGRYAVFRRAVSLNSDAPAEAGRDGIVRLKIFNLLVPEIGPKIMKTGIILSAEDFLDLMDKYSEQIENKASMNMEGRVVALEELKTALKETENVFIQIFAESEAI